MCITQVKYYAMIVIFAVCPNKILYFKHDTHDTRTCTCQIIIYFIITEKLSTADWTIDDVFPLIQLISSIRSDRLLQHKLET